VVPVGTVAGPHDTLSAGTWTGPESAWVTLPQGADPPPSWLGPPRPPRQEPPLDRVSVAAFVVGLLGLVPVAVPLGIVGMVRTRSGFRRGRRFAVLSFVLAAVWTLVAGCALLPDGGPSYTSFRYSCVVDRCDVTAHGEQVVEWEASTTIIDGPVHVGSTDVVAAVGISEIAEGRATFTIEEDAVTVDEGRIMLVGDASVHLMAVDAGTVRFVVDFSPGVVAVDDVEGWIAWELHFDRLRVSCAGDLVAEVGAWVTCSAGAGDHVSSEVEVKVLEVRDEDVELAVEVVSRPEPRSPQSRGRSNSVAPATS
jgi:hypothetical protein